MPDHHKHHPRTKTGTLRRARALLTLSVAAWFTAGPQAAHALELGEIEPRSLPGEPFAARVPLLLAANEELGLQCIRILPHPDAAQGMPLPRQLKSDIETIGSQRWLAIRTPALVTAPLVGLRIEVDCNKQLAKNYVVSLIPAPLELQVPQADSPPVVQQQAAPGISASDQGAGGARPRHDDARIAAPRQPTAAARPRATTSPAAALRKHDAQADPAQPAARKGAKTPQAAAPTSEFVLRIDAGMLDVARSEGVTEAQRETLRAMWRLNAEADDSMAARLAMANRIQQLEADLAALRGKLERQQTAAAAAVAAPAPVPVPAPAPVSGQSEDEMPWLITGGTLALLGLAGSLWWRRRRRLAEATALEPGAWATTITKPPAHDTAGAGKSAPVPATASAPARGPVAAAPVLTQIIPPLTAAPPLLTEIVAETPIAAVAAGTPPSMQALDFDLDITPPRENRGAQSLDIDIDIAPPRGDRAPQSLDLNIEFTPPAEDRTRIAQEAYFAGRFGADSQDIRILHDLDTVIEQARTFYQDDGDALKAADMLELTIALHPDSIRLWLALFAIYRCESMVRQYALLAHKFEARFATDPNWPIVQQLGREIDADNRLYGPPAATDGAAAAPAEGASGHDVTDQWLGVQLDFNSTLLASELRDQLVSGATAGAPLAAIAG